MEEWEYLEGHKDLYKDVMDTQDNDRNAQDDQNVNIMKINMDIKEEYKDEEYGVMKELSEGHKDMMEPPNTRNPPERCPRPLYSRDSTQEGLTIPHHHQIGNLSDPDLEEEIQEEDDEDGVMEESEFLRHLFQTNMVESSSYRNPPERCPRPLYSRDSTQEGHNYTILYQRGNLQDSINIKEEYIKEDGKYGVMKKFPEGHKDMMESPNTRNPPERCPRPLYSRDSTQEGHTIPHHHQGEDLMNMKVEGEVEEDYVWDDQQYTEEAGMMRTFIVEETRMEKPSKDRLTLSPGCRMEDEDITGDYAGEKTMISTMDGGLHSVDRPWNPSDSEQPRTVRNGAGIQGEKTFPCPECRETFSSKLRLFLHQKSHRGEKLLSCSECGECFLYKSELDLHCTSHHAEKPYSCPECGKCFSRKSYLSKHQRLHTKGQPYSCPECGKCFTQQSDLDIHQRSHTEEGKPYSCAECGKCYTHKLDVVIHQKSHAVEKPYSCPDCGKCFLQKSCLVRHRRLHTGEKLSFCPECGKSFPCKSDLIAHQRSHTGEKPYSCPECGKCFSQKSHIYSHRRSHTGERPYSCSECGKTFSQKSSLTKHQMWHTQENLLSCPECGKCFLQKSALISHLKSHAAEKP
ncbi:uncharacterized protein [Aquarana catesbeiana]|uniref:uncharacterized protein n=1 Tax=Aquarana catesbeiana TaxID=8400 RepID=UPI003CC9E364